VGRDLLENLRAGLRLALLRPVDAWAFRVGAGQLVLLALVQLALHVALYGWYTEPPREFTPGGLYGFVFLLAVDGVVAYSLARLAGAPERTLGVAVAMVAAGVPYLPVYFAAYYGAYALPSFGEQLAFFVSWAAYLWQAVVAYRAARAFLWLAPVRIVPVIGTFAVAAYALQTWAPLPIFWWTGWDEAEIAAEPEPPFDVEAAFAAQPGLLAAVREHLAPQRPGIVDLYFVAFAGDSSQDVFLREVRSARELLDERFDTAGRSVVLANHRSTVDSLPLATRRNLRDVLGAVAERMDEGEDVLFLFLTGHGSADHELSVSLPETSLVPIDPPELAGAIAASGIRNRVVVVSACYSGGFTPALRADTAIVATASAEDRRSFGCSNEAEYTYYGEALFAHALRDSLSFPAAFEAARRAVAKRERDEEKQPSLPQLYVGDALRPRLAELERRLAALPTSPSSGSPR
jgi:hypothetical protein